MHDPPSNNPGGDGPDESSGAGLPGMSELDRFIDLLTRNQSGLRAYIFAALGNHNDAADVMQRTNLVLWKNAASFRPDAEFMPWAVTIAKYEILSFYRDRSRDKLVFSSEVASLLMQSAQDEVADPGERQDALRTCLKTLPKKSRQMIQMRYEEGGTLLQIAENLGRTENAIKCAFLRVRRALENCVERQLKA
ncbi:sigma-70 family RNA polymerase sigma factor [Pseudobythopirellula maris]|nr:sigma-70 family RNA polymerase sigma factor [Pseudobythopirellula maris]